MNQSIHSWLTDAGDGTLLFGGARMALLDIEAGFWGLRRQLEALVGSRLADNVLQQAGINGGASFARSFSVRRAAADPARALRDCIAAYQAAGFGHFEIEQMTWPIGQVSITAHDVFEAWAAQRHVQQPDRPICAYSAGVLVGFVNVLTERSDVVCLERTCQAQGADACRFELLPFNVAGAGPAAVYAPDPAIGKQLNLLELLFERMPMGIAVFDRELVVRRFNPTWASFIDRYTPSTLPQVVPGAHLFDLAAGSEAFIEPLLERVWRGETVRRDTLRSESGGIVSYKDVVFAPLLDDGQVIGAIEVVTDATGRVTMLNELQQAYQTLEHRVEERTGELTTLLTVQQAITRRLDIEAVLQLIADEARRLTGTRNSVVYVCEGDELRLAVMSGELDRGLLGLRVAIEQTVVGLAIQSGEPILVTDALHDPRVNIDLARRAETNAFLIVPLLTSTGSIGAISVNDKLAGTLGTDDERVLTLLASSAVIGLENARLYQAEHDRRQVAEGLRDILAVLNSNRPQAEVMSYIIQQAVRLLHADAGQLFRLEQASSKVIFESSCGMPPDIAAIQSGTVDHLRGNQQLRDRQPVGLTDFPGYVAAELANPAAHMTEFDRQWYSLLIRQFHSRLGVPLIVKDALYGGLTFYYREPHQFTEDDHQLAMSLADQAALAIENARQHGQAQESAIAAERDRLARDLHDAVTQTLFSASLIADVLPRLWERNQPEARRRLEELRDLTRGALAEMRTLLLELRPAALADTDLSDLLHQLGDAVTGRARLPIEVRVTGRCASPPEVKVALYRIAQEALNNSAKYAEARHVTVIARCVDTGIQLVISDDGRGFEPDQIPPNHLGLGIMRDRAEAIGAQLMITSSPGQGTQIDVMWQTSSSSVND